jgi:hypothetical protein
MACMASAQKGRWLISTFAGQSVIVFGSSDPRVASGGGVTYSFGDQSKLRSGPHTGELIGELYYDYSKSNGVKEFPANSSSAFGLLLMSRYRWKGADAPSLFFDIGWGVQSLSRTSHDLESKINSTPVIDFGFIVGPDHERGFVGARFMHISNAHTVGNNQGQNQFFLLIQLPL